VELVSPRSTGSARRCMPFGKHAALYTPWQAAPAALRPRLRPRRRPSSSFVLCNRLGSSLGLITCSIEGIEVLRTCPDA
jgi:hypothetical protein